MLRSPGWDGVRVLAEELLSAHGAARHLLRIRYQSHPTGATPHVGFQTQDLGRQV